MFRKKKEDAIEQKQDGAADPAAPAPAPAPAADKPADKPADPQPAEPAPAAETAPAPAPAPEAKPAPPAKEFTAGMSSSLPSLSDSWLIQSLRVRIRSCSCSTPGRQTR